MKHWVDTACREQGLSKQATAYLMGHDFAAGGAMRDWYDNPGLEKVFAEQARRIPQGPLGNLRPPSLTVVGDGLPEEATEILMSYFAGEIGSYETGARIEAVKIKLAKASTEFCSQ